MGTTTLPIAIVQSSVIAYVQARLVERDQNRGMHRWSLVSWRIRPRSNNNQYHITPYQCRYNILYNMPSLAHLFKVIVLPCINKLHLFRYDQQFSLTMCLILFQWTIIQLLCVLRITDWVIYKGFILQGKKRLWIILSSVLCHKN